MKKLSLILALILVLTCGVLAACNDEGAESSEAVSTTESAAESKAESTVESETESTAESTTESTAESTEESSEAVSEEESKEPVAAGDDNLAAGKTYTTSEQFRQGGADVGWGWDDNAPFAYPDEPGSLTDGIKADEESDYQNAVWAGWTGVHPNYADTGYAWITIDLGEAKDLAKFVAYIGSSKLDQGIGAGNMTVSIAVSDDGETFEVVGEATPVDDPSTIHAVTTVELGETVNAQYVQFRLARGGWMFVSELEVFGAAE